MNILSQKQIRYFVIIFFQLLCCQLWSQTNYYSCNELSTETISTCFLNIGVRDSSISGFNKCNDCLPGPVEGGQAAVVVIAEDEILVAAAPGKGQVMKESLEAIGAKHIDSNQCINVSTNSIENFCPPDGSIPNLQSKQNRVPNENYLQRWKLPESIMIISKNRATIRVPISSYYGKFNFISALPGVGFIEPNYILKVIQSTEVNDTTEISPIALDILWNLTSEFGIDALKANTYPDSDTMIKVGVIDTDIYWQHPDLIDNIWQNLGEDADGDGTVLDLNDDSPKFDECDLNGIDDDGNGYVDDLIGWDAINNNGRLDIGSYQTNMAIEAHGTHVSGILAGEGIGVSKNVKIIALKCFGSKQGTVWDIMQGLCYALKNDIKITNNSYGGYFCSESLYNIIDSLNKKGSLFIASAGNHGKSNDTYPFNPASYDLDNVISVTSINQCGKSVKTHNYGKSSVDIAAPGVDIFSTVPVQYGQFNVPFNFKTGTSMATPHVTGAAALLCAEEPDLTHLEIKERLLCRAKPIADLENKCVSGGVVNVMNAIADSDNLEVVIEDCDNGAKCFRVEPEIDAKYEWKFFDAQLTENNDNPILTDNLSQLIVTNEAIKKYCVELIDNCGVRISFPCGIVSIIPSMDDPIEVVINQMTDESFLSIDLDLEPRDNFDVFIYNSSIELVQRLVVMESIFHFEQEVQLEITNFPEGVYTVRVDIAGEDVLYEKIINL